LAAGIFNQLGDPIAQAAQSSHSLLLAAERNGDALKAHTYLNLCVVFVGRLEEPGYARLLEGRDRRGGRLVGKLLVILLVATVLVGGILVYEYLRDKELPIIEKLDFKIRVEKGQTQDLLVCVRERDPSEYAVLYVNGTSISIPPDRKD